ncbi:MAG: terpene cyclase/mutase family protein [Asgard group archaeon]|nr:terpene cyclase/mutase family protein [Asgard group archaeon]
MVNQISICSAINYVKTKGSNFDQTKLAIILNENAKKNSEKLLEYFTSLQNLDGGFPFGGQAKNYSTVNVTTSYLLTMLDYNIYENPVFNNALNFIIQNQHIDGYWNEPGLIISYKPPKWDDPREPYTPIWLTANICFLLARLGLDANSYFKKGIDYLLDNLEDNGKIKGYLQATWLTVAALSIIKYNDVVIKKLLDALNLNLKSVLNTSSTIWCLHSLIDGGFNKENIVVKKLVENIISLQQKNGSWVSVDGETFDTSTTLEAIFLFKKLIF